MVYPRLTDTKEREKAAYLLRAMRGRARLMRHEMKQGCKHPIDDCIATANWMSAQSIVDGAREMLDFLYA